MPPDAVPPLVTTDVTRAAGIARAGGLVAFPTETVYGLGAVIDDRSAVARIFEVKGRPAEHPLIVHLSGAEELSRWVTPLPAAARRLAEAFWPGPLTIIVPRGEQIPPEVAGGRATVGVRVPDHPMALALLEAVGTPMAAPSANRFGRVSPTRAEHVVADLGTEVDCVLDGGPCAVGVESTIVDVTVDPPVVLRRGALDAHDLSVVLGEVTQWDGDGPARAPGMLAAHYSPSARVVVVADPSDTASVLDPGIEPGRIAVLAPSSRGTDELGEAVRARLGSATDVVELEPAGSALRFAQVLYDRLRQADRLGVSVLVVVPPEGEGVAAAVRDRLARAAAGHQPR